MSVFTVTTVEAGARYVIECDVDAPGTYIVVPEDEVEKLAPVTPLYPYWRGVFPLPQLDERVV